LRGEKRAQHNQTDEWSKTGSDLLEHPVSLRRTARTESQKRWLVFCFRFFETTMIRPKTSAKLSARRESPFAFRRIQDRELYQPSQDSDPQTRVRYRIRLQVVSSNQ
jgi:hypothetical protein